jgi:hypothetical protein
MGKVCGIKMILAAMLVVICAGMVYGYPPENAAVLYYKAAAIYEVDEEMGKVLADLQKGRVDVNDAIREFVRKKQQVVDTLLDASVVKHCDWGLNYSQGFTMDVPYLGKMRKLSQLVVAKAKILSADGDYEGAIGYCMGLGRMARHVNDRTFICYLVAIAINSMSNECLAEIMGDMPYDKDNFNLIKRQLQAVERKALSIRPALSGELELTLTSINCGKLEQTFGNCGIIDESLKVKIFSQDEEAILRSREYFERYYEGVVEAFDMPYVQGHLRLEEIQGGLLKDAKTRPEAYLPSVLAPATSRLFAMMKRFETHNNAIRVGIEVYLIKAERGELPEELPADLGGDEFGGGDFIYERTAEGFTLRCVGKDFGKEESFEYKFKVRK